MNLALLCRWFVFPLAAYVLASCFAEKRSAPWLRAILIAGTAVVAVALLKSATTATHYVQEWDFMCFWLYGHAAAAHANVYAPATYHALTLPMPVDSEFRREVLDVGFPYPPPSIFLFLPLGYLASFATASALWLAAMLAAFAAGIAILVRTYVRDRGIDAIVAVAALALALPAAADNVAYHQTNFLAFAFLAAAYAWRRSFGGGIVAALAVVVKPYLAAIMLWLALRRRWNAFAASVVTLAVVSAAAIPLLGRGGLHAFLADNPSTRLPPWIFAETEMASLYAFLLRIAHRDGSLTGPLHDPAYVAIAAILALATVWLVVAAPKCDDDIALGLCVALGLMLYPGAGTMYAIALVPALVALARRAGTQRVAAFTALAFGFFVADATSGVAAFIAFAAVWFVLAATLVAARRRSGDALQSSRAAMQPSARLAPRMPSTR